MQNLVICQLLKLGKNMEDNSEVFPRGFVTGLRKLLGEVDD
jgi:hypothetical protein